MRMWLQSLAQVSLGRVLASVPTVYIDPCVYVGPVLIAMWRNSPGLVSSLAGSMKTIDTARTAPTTATT